MGTLIHFVAHGLVANDTIMLGNLVGGAGLSENTQYYVLAAGLTANDFAVGLTAGGAAIVFTTDITDGVVVRTDTYQPNTGVMAPPTAPTAPGSCVLSSAAVLAPDGTVVSRLDITITQPASATLRHTIVTITGGSNVEKVIIPVGQTTGSIASVVPGVSYTGSAVAYDTFGLSSSATASAAHVAAGDTTAPAQITGATAYNGILGVSVAWTASASADLSHYEVQIDTANTFATATTYRTKGNLASLYPLAAGTFYMRIRAVDLSGNAGTYSSTVNSVSRITDAVTNSTAKVTIDASGLTITDGALSIKDDAGVTVMTASGFAGNWADFIATGLYNGRFLSGVAGVIPVGRTSALPYWTLADTTGSPVATFVTNGGVAVTFAALSNKKSFTSDSVQVHPAAVYQANFTVSINKAGGTLFLILATFIDWFQADGTASAITATNTLDTNSFSATLGATLINTLLPVRPPSDARFAKLRFTVEESSLGTHTVGNKLTLLSSSFKEVANTSVGIGAAFPTTPAPLTYDRFFNTTYQQEFFWQGSRWVSSNLYRIPLNRVSSIAATNAGSFDPADNGGSDIWLEESVCPFFVVGGGTALGASHKWVGVLSKRTGADVPTTLATHNVASGASGTWRRDTVSIAALLKSGTDYFAYNFVWTKTGTPGAMSASPYLTYRIVGT